MFKKYSTVFSVVVLCVFVLSSLAIAGKFNEQRAYRVTPEDMVKWDAQIGQMVPSNGQLPVEVVTEVGRTWYDYATNNITARQLNHSANGLHFAFMKRIDQANPYVAGTRYVTYDYYDLTLGLFFGNQSVTEAVATGWGRVLNGANDEALISMHGGGLWLWQDASEAGYNFTALNNVAGTGVFPGIARLGNTIIFMGQLANANWYGGDTIIVSTDYGTTWTGQNVFTIAGATDLGVGEMWPTINPTNPTEFSVPICPNTATGYISGSTWISTTTDLGATWNHTLVWDDDAVFGPTQSQYIIENFGQFNSMYTQDGVYHLVMGAVQGVADTATSTAIDMFPILYWNTREQTIVELTDAYYGRPTNAAAIPVLSGNRPGNGLGNGYPTLSEGPNSGELVCIWQQWEDDGTGVPVLLTPTGTGSGVQIFATDIWGSYSNDGGMTWSTPFFVAGASAISDVYPYLPDNFIWNATSDSIYLDVMWMYDTNPSVSFNNFPTWSEPTEAIWQYERVVVAATPASTGIGGDDNVVTDYALAQNYPNPFNPTTTIAFQLKNAGDVSIDIFNTLGQQVATVLNQNMTAGSHKVEFDASNLASGLYVYRLTSGNVSLSKKMMLLK